MTNAIATKNTNAITTKITSTASINCQSKKVRACYFLHRVLLVIIFRLIMIVIYYYYAKHKGIK